MTEVQRVSAERLVEVVELHCEAFADYPTMRFVLGPAAREASSLETLIGYFIDTTHLQGGAVLAIEENGRLVAAADTVASPAPAPAELDRRRREVWAKLGDDARRRYAQYSRLKEAWVPERPHHYLSMLGVRPRWAGRGLARPLLEAVQKLSREHPESTGVALETEDPANVAFYRHFGYRLVGQAKTEGIESWGFFRPNDG